MIYGPKRGVAFSTYLPLVTKGAADWKDAPTIAAGDFQVKKDAAGFANLATLPALDAAGEKVVKVSFSASEMDAVVVVLRGIDQTATKEWEDTGMVIITTANGVGLQSGDAYARLGAPAGASVSADVAAVKGDTAAVKAKTDNLPPDPADASDIAVALALVQADTDNIQTRIPAALVGGRMAANAEVVGDKTGFSLGATGLDAIPTTAPTGPAATFREMVIQTWRRFFKRATMTSTQTKTFLDDGVTPATTQANADDGTTQEQGAAS